MKIFARILILAAVSILPLHAFAADEFGTRFGGQSPAALAGTPTTQDNIMALEANKVQAIQPAAGAEKPAAKPEAKPQVAAQPEADPAADTDAVNETLPGNTPAQ